MFLVVLFYTLHPSQYTLNRVELNDCLDLSQSYVVDKLSSRKQLCILWRKVLSLIQTNSPILSRIKHKTRTQSDN